MNKIIEVSEINKLKNLKEIVLVGGCFDILHFGHITFLKKAKKLGKNLVILLESDETIKRLKGENRPINGQIKRAEMLIKLKIVDRIIILPEFNKNEDYIELIKKIGPKIIAITENDENREIKEKEAEIIGAELVVVMKRMEKYSTSKIIKSEMIQ